MLKCILIYFKPLLESFKKIEIILEKNPSIFFVSIMSGILEKVLDAKIGLDNFGVSIVTIIFVLLTIFANSVSGIEKARKKRKEIKIKIKDSTSENNKIKYRRILKSYNLSGTKLNYVFIKVLTLLSYLFMANAFVNRINLNASPIMKFVDFTAETLVVVPLFFFWYKEFKSIGENIETIYNKKPSLFKIVEDIIEFKISNIVNKFKSNKDEINK